jgi:hypothetical protein
MAFYLVRAPRKLLPGPLVLGLAVWVSLLVSVAGLGNEAVSEDSHSAPVKESSLVSSAKDTHVMVVGFMGGFVHRDDPHHPEVRLIRDLHEEYPTGAYFGLSKTTTLTELIGQLCVSEMRRGQRRFRDQGTRHSNYFVRA